MGDKEKARQELIEAYIECCKKRKKIESVEVSKGLDGHDGAKLKQITLDFIEKVNFVCFENENFEIYRKLLEEKGIL